MNKSRHNAHPELPANWRKEDPTAPDPVPPPPQPRQKLVFTPTGRFAGFEAENYPQRKEK